MNRPADPMSPVRAMSLPWPIARARARASAVSPSRSALRLTHLLTAAEALLQLVGTTILVDAFDVAREKTRELRNVLAGVRLSHAGMGLWGHTVVRVAPAVEKPFMAELSRLQASPECWRGLEGHVSTLTEVRNRFAHPMRQIMDHEAAAVLPTVESSFDSLAATFDFLSEYLLVAVQSVGRQTPRGRRMSVLPLRGRSSGEHGVKLPSNAGFDAGDVVLIRSGGDEALVLSPVYRYLSDFDDPVDGLFAYLRTENGTRTTYYRCACPGDVKEIPIASPSEEEGTVSLQAWLQGTKECTDRMPHRRALGLEGVDAKSLATEGCREWSSLLALPPDELPLSGIRHLESGGTAEVFVGLHRDLDQTWVLKVLKPHVRKSLSKKLRHEAKLLASVSHPAIVRVYHVFDTDELGPCIAEEFFDAPSLQDCLDEKDVFSPEEAVPVLLQTLQGLCCLHDKGIVHRDVKPANVLYRRDTGEVKLIDLGIAKELGGATHGTTQILAGTLEYMAPEHLEGAPAGKTTDVFSTGILAHALLTGSPPRREGLAPVFDPEVIPTTFLDLLERACHRRPEHRYQDAGEMLVALENAWEAFQAQKFDDAGSVALCDTTDASPRVETDEGILAARAWFEGHYEKFDSATRACEADFVAGVREDFNRAAQAIRTNRTNLKRATETDDHTESYRAVLAELQRKLAVRHESLVSCLTEEGTRLLVALDAEGPSPELFALPSDAAMGLEDPAKITLAAVGTPGVAVGLMAGPLGFVSAAALVGGWALAHVSKNQVAKKLDEQIARSLTQQEAKLESAVTMRLNVLRTRVHEATWSRVKARIAPGPTWRRT